jgi:hypothetical protein
MQIEIFKSEIHFIVRFFLKKINKAIILDSVPKSRNKT